MLAKYFSFDPSKRIYGLDILRAIAILLVLYAHGKAMIAPYLDVEIMNLFHFDGVTIFFVLSGYLIGRILLKIYFKKEKLTWQDLKQFWIRRWFRTVPPYFIVLTLMIIFRLAMGFKWESFYFKFYLFIQNLWYEHPPFFPEAWSLSVEEWFYLGFPFLLFFAAIVLKKRSKPDFLFVLGMILLAGMAFKTYVTLHSLNEGMAIHEFYDTILRKSVLSRIDSMMYGVIAAYIFHFHRSLWDRQKNSCFLIGIGLILFYKFMPWLDYPIFYSTCSFSVLSLGTFFILPKLNSIKSGKGWFSKLIIWISLSSYSMYLINLSVLQTIRAYLPIDTAFWAFTSYAIFWILTILISILAYQFIELPILKFRDKKYYKQSI